MQDEEGGYQATNLDAIQFVRRPMPPILGRDVLEALSSSLHIDFHAKTGYIEIG